MNRASGYRNKKRRKDIFNAFLRYGYCKYCSDILCRIEYESLLTQGYTFEGNDFQIISQVSRHGFAGVLYKRLREQGIFLEESI